MPRECASLRFFLPASSLLPFFGSFARFLETIGVAVDDDDLGLVDEPVNERHETGGAGKDLVPLIDRCQAPMV